MKEKKPKYGIYQGNETFSADAKMFFKMIIYAAVFGFVVFCVYNIIAINTVNKKFTDAGFPPSMYKKYIWTKYWTKLSAGLYGIFKTDVEPELRYFSRGKSRIQRANYIKIVDYMFEKAKNKRYRGLLTQSRKNTFTHVYIGLALGVFTIFLYIFLMARISKGQVESEFIKGAKLKDDSEIAAEMESYNRKEDKYGLAFRFGKFLIPWELENRGLAIGGTTGSGKSTIGNQIIDHSIERKDKHSFPEKNIVQDPTGDQASYFYKKGDYLFNPYDGRCLGWRFFNEIETSPDFSIMGKLLCTPEEVGNATQGDKEYWHAAPASVFAMGLKYLYQVGKTRNGDIADFFSQDLKVIERVLSDSLTLKDKSALKHILHSEKTTSARNIMSMLETKIEFFREISHLDGDFSFRKYIRNDSEKKTLFLISMPRYKKMFRIMNTFLFNIMLNENLSLDTNLNRRIHFRYDELASLDYLSTLLDHIALARKKGGANTIAFQDFGQLRKIYGEPLIDSLMNNMNVFFCMRMQGDKSPETASKILGEIVKDKKSFSRMMSPSDRGDRKNINSQEQKEQLVVPSEISQLKDFEYYLAMKNVGITKGMVPKIFLNAKHNVYEENKKIMKINIPENPRKKFKEDIKNKVKNKEEKSVQEKNSGSIPKVDPLKDKY